MQNIKGVLKMKKTRSIVAIGLIVLFLSVAFSPVSATPLEEIEFGMVDGFGGVISQTISASVAEIREADSVLGRIAERIEDAGDYEAIEAVITEVLDAGTSPFVGFLLNLIVKGIDLNKRINKLRPLKQKAFVFSHGFTRHFLSFKDNKVGILRPLTFWRYSSRSSVLFNSRTIIVDPSPFDVTILSGYQVGLMCNFAGFYLYRHSQLTGHSYTFFIGHAQRIRGYDLGLLDFFKK